MIGTNRDEGTSFSPFLQNVSYDVVSSFVMNKWGAVWGQKVVDMYVTSKKYSSAYWAGAAITGMPSMNPCFFKSIWMNMNLNPWLSLRSLGDYAFQCPARRSSRWASAAGLPVYRYGSSVCAPITHSLLVLS